MIFARGNRVRLRVDVGRVDANLVRAGTEGAVTKVENDIVHALFDGGDAWQFVGPEAYDKLEFAS